MAHKITYSLALSLLLLQPGRAEATAALACEHLPMLFQAYLRSHYSVRALTDEVKTRSVEQFIKSLDSSKTLLLEGDVAKLRKDLPVAFNGMQKGDCSALDAAFDLVVRRLEEEEKVVKEFLARDYKLDESVELMLDSDKRSNAKTTEDRVVLLKKMVHFQISNLLLTDIKLEDATKQLSHRYELAVKRFKDRKTKGEIPTLFAESFALALDPHTSFLSAENLEDFQIQMKLSLEGIGASLTSQDGFTVIEDLIPGGSAERLNILHPKDKIIAVAQDGEKPVAINDMDLRAVVKMIRGRKGTKVKLTILRQADKTETFDVTIVRDKIDIKESAAKITYETRKSGGKTRKVGILDLPSFYGSNERGGRSSYRDVKNLLEEAKRNKVEGIVLNLSRNGGGLLEDAVRISGLFIRKGGVVATQDTGGRRDVLEDKDEEVVWSGPLLVLTSHLSASASEILAGALKDYKRAIIVGGEHTFGKGTVQVLSGLPANLGAMKVTTGMYFLPAGPSTQHTGVKTDFSVPSIFNNEDVGEKTMDYSLPPQSTKPFISLEANATEPGMGGWTPVDGLIIKTLGEKSRDRVAKDVDFVEVRKDLEEAKKKGMIKLADLRKKAKKDESKNKKLSKKDAKQKLKDMEAPFIKEGVDIMGDWMAMAAAAPTATAKH